MRPTVSIGITTYNRAHLVTSAIDSVLAQDYAPLEVVVVDDGSSDDTLAVLERYRSEPRVRIVALPQNGGIPVAKNAALDALSGDYGGLLDSDDLLLPGAITACVDAFEQLGPSYSQVIGDCLDSRTGELTGRGPNVAGPVMYEQAICDSMQGEFWNLFRMSDLGSLRFHPEALTSESLVWHAMLRRKPGYYIHQPVRVYVREGIDRISNARATPRIAHGRMMAYQAYLEIHGADVRRHCPRRFAELAQEFAKWQARCGRRAAALTTLWQAVRAGGAPGLSRAAAVVVAPAFATEAALRIRASLRSQRRS